MTSLLAACVASLTFCGQASASPLKPYTLPFGVQVSLPAKPEKHSGAGAKTEVYVSIAEKIVYTIGSGKMNIGPGQGPPDQQLAAAVMGMMDAYPGKLVSYRDVLLNGWPGLEYQIQGQTLSAYVRSFDVDDRMLNFMVAYPNSGSAHVRQKEFFDSVSLADGTKAGPFTSPGLLFKPLALKDVPFAIEMPGAPVDQPTNLASGAKALILHRFTYEKDLRDLMFGYSDAMTEGPAPTRDDMKQFRELLASGVIQGAQKSELKTAVRDGAEWTTGDFQVDDRISGRVEVVIIGKRIYLLMEAGPNPWVHSPDFKHLFDSFTLTKTP